MEATHGDQHFLVRRINGASGLRQGNLDLELGELGQELVQRRVDQTHGHRLAVHDLEHCQEVLLLQLLQGVECFLTLSGAFLGEDDALNQRTTRAQEHVLGTAQADALRTELQRALRVLGGVGVGANLQATHLVGVGEDAVDGLDQFGGAGVASCRSQASFEAVAQVGGHRGVGHGDLTQEDFTGLAVDGDNVFTGQDASGDGHGSGLGIDLEGFSATDTGLTHAARNDSGVRGLATAGGQNALGCDHTGQVVGVGFAADQHALDACCCRGLGLSVVEDDAANGCARRGGHTASDEFLGCRCIELREHQLGELVTGHAAQGLVAGDELFVDQLDSDAESGGSGALADAGLEHPQLAALDGEFDVAQVAVVGFELVHDSAQLVVDRLVDLLKVGQGQGVADTCNDVFALCVLEVIAVHTRVTGGGVAGEAHAGAGVFAHVAEHHGADVDCGTQVVGDALTATVDACALGVPGAENGLDGHVHLGARILREFFTGLLVDDGLEDIDQVLEVLSVELGIALNATFLLHVVQRVGEEVSVDVQNGLAEHLDEATVGVPRETLVAADSSKTVDGFVVQADVEDGFHHAGHGELCARADRDKQRILGITQLATHFFFDLAKCDGHFSIKTFRGLAVVQVDAARFGGNCESGRNRQAELRHLCQVRTLTSEQVFH